MQDTDMMPGRGPRPNWAGPAHLSPHTAQSPAELVSGAGRRAGKWAAGSSQERLRDSVTSWHHDRPEQITGDVHTWRLPSSWRGYGCTWRKTAFLHRTCYFPWRLISQYPLELMSATSGEIFWKKFSCIIIVPMNHQCLLKHMLIDVFCCCFVSAELPGIQCIQQESGKTCIN